MSVIDHGIIAQIAHYRQAFDGRDRRQRPAIGQSVGRSP